MRVKNKDLVDAINACTDTETVSYCYPGILKNFWRDFLKRRSLPGKNGIIHLKSILRRVPREYHSSSCHDTQVPVRKRVRSSRNVKNDHTGSRRDLRVSNRFKYSNTQ